MIETAAKLAAVDDDLLPGILKTARLGYDGKGQVACATRAELAAAWDGARAACPACSRSCCRWPPRLSVIVARGADGEIVHLPVQRQPAPRRHPRRDAGAGARRVAADRRREAIDARRAIAAGLDYVGVLCVEFFVLADGALVVNEMAPRPHNRGHYSIDACDVSQFELQVRALAGAAAGRAAPALAVRSC